MTNYQSEIAANVAARGYREGWTDEQYAARQVCKLGEELGELVRSVLDVEYIKGRDYWQDCQIDTGKVCREAFDRYHHLWTGYLTGKSLAASEAADMLVVLYNLADALGVDLNALALEKSKSDVERGVR